VIENRSGSLRLTLNGAESHRTLAGRFIAETFGSSVQHIAFTSKDIFLTSETLRRNGMLPLDISPNYYEDLDARLGLAPDFLGALQSHNLLYDKDDGGEYFQLYSPNLGDGFFFEIVQRTGSYAGYGAVNAPFRIAAQKRAAKPPTLPTI
jgi:4-hydroxyphenylpyruvate dioxygenase